MSSTHASWRPAGLSGGSTSAGRAASVEITADSSDDDDGTTYKVVLNHEEQYSLWPADRDPPEGWREAGKSGTKAECLAYVEEVWTDMRPLSLRQRMDGSAPEAG